MWIVIAVSIAAAQTLPDDHGERMDRGVVLFRDRVESILKERCVRCHGGDATRGQLDLATRDGLIAGGKEGEVVAPFDAAASRLLQLVRHEERPEMPWREPKLAADEIAALEQWIDLGAPYERPLVERKAGKAAPIREVTDRDRDAFAFRPLARPDVPAASADGGREHAVDRFLAATQHERGIAPAAPASRRVLLRRAWFDMVGLPPPPDEVASFLADAAPDAFARRVDGLLASPRFGERWARHWLDVARFAESHGFEHDYDRPHAWPYRDFVIDALNADLPFDRFVQWQIAGDEFAPDDPQAWFATGFLGAGVHATQITESQVEKERYDELDDVVATIGTSMLGLTIGCARCHDHKFDPIPARDYYRMVATFTTTVRSDFDVVVDAADHRARLAAWTAEHERIVAPLERFDRDDAPQRLERWLAARAGAGERIAPASWIAPSEATVASAGGATFERLDDGSFLASGARVERDEYAVAATFEPGALARIAALRIEALADASLVKQGPGRAENGNFGLTELRATWRPKGASEAVAITFASARSTFDQSGLPASAAIDGDETPDAACWAVDPEFGRDHAASFALATPLDASEGGTLQLTLLFRTNVFHGIGRLRVAVAGSADAGLRDEAIDSAASAALLRLDRGEDPADGERRALERWLARRDPERQRLAAAVRDHVATRPAAKTQKALVCSEGLPAIRLHTQGGDFLDATHFLQRGDPAQKREIAPPGFLQVLTRAPDPDERWRARPPEGARTPGLRTELARWLTDVDSGAGNLLARVAVNRIWQHVFGRGIVATPSDFGSTGAKPSHPELLEWLACELIARGWSVKAIVRELVLSDAWAQGVGGAGDAAAIAADPSNELFARRPARRLEAEAIRDAMLAVSGELDSTMHGPGTLDVGSPRRSVYLFVKRSRLVPMLSLFDAPNALSGIGARQITTVAPQALFLLNAPAMRRWSEALVRRIERDAAVASGASVGSDGTAPCSDAEFVRRGFELCFARPPDSDELADSLAFLANGAAAARADLCQALLGANEFVHVE